MLTTIFSGFILIETKFRSVFIHQSSTVTYRPTITSYRSRRFGYGTVRSRDRAFGVPCSGCWSIDCSERQRAPQGIVYSIVVGNRCGSIVHCHRRKACEEWRRVLLLQLYGRGCDRVLTVQPKAYTADAAVCSLFLRFPLCRGSRQI